MRRRPTLAAVMLLVLVPACGRSRSEAPPSRERVLVAVLGGFTGPDPALAEAMSRGGELAVRQYNAAAGSTYRATLKREDTAGTADGAQGAAERLAGEDLLIGVVGPGTLDEAESAGRTLTQAQIPMLLPTITAGGLAEAGLSGYRRLVADDHRQGVVTGGEAAALAAGQKVAIVRDGGGEAADFARGAREAVDAAKVPVSRVETLRPRSDLAALSTSIVRDGAGVVVHAGPAERAGAVAASLRAAGFKGRLLASSQARDPRFAEWAKDGASGTLAVCPCAAAADPQVAGFARSYGRVFRRPPPPYALESYEGTLMLLEAIEEVEPRKEEVLGFFHNARSFLGISKLYAFDDQGELLDAPVWIDEFRDGRWQFVRRAGPGPTDGR
ncbi:MAG: branched-chain amino acid ABC transporter substrate-binding protein [Actinomycetota bacterium]